MKNLDYQHIYSLGVWLQDQWTGAQLQDVWTNGRIIVLNFYLRKEIYIVIDADLTQPVVGVFLEKPNIGKKNKPTTLFLKSHGKNLRISKVETHPDWGRVLKIHLGRLETSPEFFEGRLPKEEVARKVILELVLIPRSFNFLVTLETIMGNKQVIDKTLSWKRPKELPISISMKNPPVLELDWFEFSKNLFTQNEAGHRSMKSSGSTELISKKNINENTEIKIISPQEKALNKKKEVLKKLQENWQTMDSHQWRLMGESLKNFFPILATEDEVKSFFENAIVELAGVEVLKLYDFKKTPSQNREQAFKNYRQIEEKKARLKERLQVLEKEVQKMEKEFNYQSQFNEKLKVEKLQVEKLHAEELQAENIKEQKTIQFGGPGKFFENNHSVPHKGLLEKAQAQGRRLELNDNLFAVIGKTAKDNLSILRKAQAWDLWLHLKDFPGAHAIITRPRNYEVSLAQIQKVATWVIKESFKNRNIDMGEYFEVLIVETRYVKPIKGDKLGRVTYQNPKVVRVKTES